MKVSYNWLRQFIDLSETPEEIADILTATGLEVEGIEQFQSVRGGLQGLVVGEVITCKKHPNADKLSLTTVDIGNGQSSKIVCGAPNVKAGQKVIVAPVGTTIYPHDKEDGLKLKKAKIRGEVSEGMICSAYELGLSEDHTGIMVLDTKKKNGTPVTEVLEVGNDHVLEIGLTPNRGDATSHLGVCRDLKAVLGRELQWPDVSSFKVDDHEFPIEVEVEDHEGAPRYSGLTISNLRISESPEWLKNRLQSVGLAPINNVVDITNYVNHSIGQPMHAFDYDAITGQKVVVKTMPEGSRFVTLDEKERKLTTSDLMICNSKEGMCIGGVFGGIKSGVKDSTTSIFLESACFSPDYIRKTAQHHGLKTDASFRFERGTDPDLTVFALKWAAVLMRELAGGRVSSEVIDIYPQPVKSPNIKVLYNHVDRLIGKQLDRKTILEILDKLDIGIKDGTKEGFTAIVPPYRVDVLREADVIEEILRIYGYDNVALDESLNSDFLSDFPVQDNNNLQFRISELLSSRGYYEIVTNSLTKTKYAREIASLNENENVEIINKLSDDLGVMRQSMLPGGLEVINYNISHRQKDLHFFEFGKVYKESKGRYQETEILAIYLTGARNPEHWSVEEKPADFHDLALDVYSCLERVGIYGYDSVELTTDIWSQGLEVSYQQKVLGRIGYVSDYILRLAEVSQPVLYAELDWQALLKRSNQHITYREVPKYPEVRRDLSIVLDKTIRFSEIRDLAVKTERKLIRKMNVFSVYEGENIGKDKKAYAISFILQDENQTLKDKQIDNVMSRLIRNFEKELGALIRK